MKNEMIENSEKEAMNFEKVAEVLAYLQDQGWTVSRPSFYRHVKEGKLKKTPDGGFSQKTVDRYAKMFLISARTGKRARESAAEQQRKILKQQIELNALKIRNLERRNAIEASQYIPASEALSAFTTLTSFTREKVMEIPDRVLKKMIDETAKNGGRKLDEPQVRNILDLEIRQTLENVSNEIKKMMK